MVPVEYGMFSLSVYLTMWLFKYITGMVFRGYYVLWSIVYMLVCIDIWQKLRIYMVNAYPVK